MAKRKPGPAQQFASDPFQERVTDPLRRRYSLLGQPFCFESNSRPLLRLVDAAYAGLPAHHLNSAHAKSSNTLVSSLNFVMQNSKSRMDCQTSSLEKSQLKNSI